ncbi:unnamed protein product [Staurois parvus]|uniref:Uncharacterized protein n=1 Tax=Staurois parvus TaxID=386267 RepID=A0ABN9GT50_9NEOB|nr:unnamed protein product [Staurois parvus]
MWARTQGPHDPLLPGGPMSCQSAPGRIHAMFPSDRYKNCIYCMPGVSRGPHEMPLVPFS